MTPLSTHVRHAAKVLEGLEKDLEHYFINDDRYEPYERNWEFIAAPRWEKLAAELLRANTMHNPTPNNGLAAIWLRVVARMAQQVEELASTDLRGYDALIIEHYDHPSLRWLTRHASDFVLGVFRAEYCVDKTFADMANPHVHRRSLEDLLDLAQKLEKDNDGNEEQLDDSKVSESLKLAEGGIITKECCDTIGKYLLQYLNDGYAVKDSNLDEVVLISLLRSYKSLQPKHVFAGLAQFWLTEHWQGLALFDYGTHSTYQDILCKLDEQLDLKATGAEAASLIRQIVQRLKLIGDSIHLPPKALYDLDPTTCQVTYKGKAYSLNFKEFQMLEALLDSDDWVSMSGIGIAKPDKVHEKLPPPIQKLIESGGPGKGYRIMPKYRHTSVK